MEEAGGEGIGKCRPCAKLCPHDISALKNDSEHAVTLSCLSFHIYVTGLVVPLSLAKLLEISAGRQRESAVSC